MLQLHLSKSRSLIEMLSVRIDEFHNALVESNDQSKALFQTCRRLSCTTKEVSNDKDQGFIGYINIQNATFNWCGSCDVKLLNVQ